MKTSSRTVIGNGPKITVQYRAKRGKVYELKSGEAQLAVHISPPEGPGDSGNWHVEARSGVGTSGCAVDGWGATAADAFRDVARAWTSHLPSLAVFDWEAVARELQGVRAL
jgi:hypothetical protein